MAVVCLVFLSMPAPASVPVVPSPKRQSEHGSCGPLRYGHVHVRSEFPAEATEAALERLEGLCDGSEEVMDIRIRRGRRNASGDGGYRLSRRGLKVRIRTASEEGAHYALQSLVQVVRAGYDRRFSIRDWPDMTHRIYMDDISRGEVPTMEQVKRQIRFLSELKYTAYLFYNENVVRLPSHPDFVPDQGCFTVGDLDEISAYARRFHIDFIGGQQSFGHLEKILSLPGYRSLGLTENMLDAGSEEARRFISDILSDWCDHCPSDYFCLFCDETFDLSQVADKERYYAEYISFLADCLRSRGKRAVICGDMLIKYPAILPMLPRDLVVMTWNYDSMASYAEWIDPFRDGEREWWVAPGVHSSNRMLPDMRAAEGNRRFIAEAYAAGSRGTMVCSWDESTYHPFQHLRYGLAQFAESMWDISRTSVDDDFCRRYESVFFGAPNGVTALYDAMMQLGTIPLFSGMNDRIFYQRFTPSEDAPLVVDLSAMRQADSLILSLTEGFDKAERILRYNRREMEAWRYALDCYRFLTDARAGMDEACRNASNGKTLQSLARCDTLLSQVEALREGFIRWWEDENQPYNYQGGLETFGKKREELLRVRNAFQDGRGNQFRVLDRENGYMCFWLTTLLSPEEKIPPEELSLAPTPGRRFLTERKGEGPRETKWSKTESFSGLSMDVNALFGNPSQGSVLYAFSQLTAGRDLSMDLYLGFVGACTVFLDESVVFDRAFSNHFSPDAVTVPLVLTSGPHRLFIRLEKQYPECAFSACMEGGSVSSRKHKYEIR